MKDKPFVVELRPVRRETISSDEYLKLVKNSPGLIVRAQFVPPSQGTSGFGQFDVRYTRTRHRSMTHG